MNLFGQVTDAATGASLPNATIAIYDFAGKVIDGTITDAEGYYSIEMPPISYAVASYVGYDAKRIGNTSGQGYVKLKQSTNLLGEAIASAKKPWPLWLKVAAVATVAIGIGAIIMYIRNK